MFRLKQMWCQMLMFVLLVDRIMLEEADRVLMVSQGPRLLIVSTLFSIFFTTDETAESSVLPQANTCTDLMTVFCRSYVAAREMEMYVCVIRVKCTQWLSSCAQQSLRNTSVC